MKKFLIIINSIFIFGCSSYCQNKKIVYDCVIKDSISQEDKSINIDKYRDELYKNGGFTLFENDTILIDVSLNSSSFTKRTENKKSHIIKAIEYDEITKKVITFRFYYDKGKFAIGKRYNYDSSGNIIKVINNDDPENYTLCYKEAEAIVMKRVGKKYEIENIARREETIKNQKVYLWSVIATIKGSRKYSDSKNFWIDSKTGKILKVLKLYHFD